MEVLSDEENEKGELVVDYSAVFSLDVLLS